MNRKLKSLNEEIREIKHRKRCKEMELMNTVEIYLKTECYESYKKNNLKEAFEKAEHDDTIRLEILNIIDGFLIEDNKQKNMF